MTINASCVVPFSLSGRWLKGNVHTHTTQSDGLFPPHQAIDWYRQRGYDFLAITDHWVLTPGEMIADDFVTITGTEVDGEGYHMLALGLNALPDREKANAVQQVTDSVLAAEGLPFMAHPYWMGQTSADIAAVDGVIGLEVFNAVCERMAGLGYARVQWDEVLAQGRYMTGLAVDDTHWKHGAAGTGFLMVRCERLDEKHILEAIRQGHFYASMGPIVKDLCLVEGEEGERFLSVECSPCQSITFYALGSKGHRFEASEDELLESARYPIAEEQLYLRVECMDAAGKVAWTNPLFVEGLL
ncbi:MAG: CehA/McbA family metallohydrolase [Chloroflexota bacterium]|nr:CehA/McbA family metallohydrolase [Chloroflexota bacterium]